MFQVHTPPPRLHPRVKAHRSGRLRVSDLHEIYWEEYGSDDGIPVVGLHGGPGGGGNSEIQRFFDPSRYRIFLFDQRGCGRSSPASELRENTTWDLVADMELLRETAGVDRWLVFGGSWGATLALTYAAMHRSRVSGLVLRGVFLLTEAEIRWFYSDGANRIFPDAYEKFLAPIPVQERHDIITAYHRRLTGSDARIRAEAAQAWAQWEGDTLSVRGASTRPSRFDDSEFQDAFARIECHYFVNRGFFAHDGWLLDQIKTFGNLPGIVVHGRFDTVTPLSSAWALKNAWPTVQMTIVPDAGHSSLEPGIARALIAATDHFARRLDKDSRGGRTRR